MILGDGDFGALFLTLRPLFENHFKCDPEQKQTTGNAERANGNAEHTEDLHTRHGKQRHDDETDDGSPKRDLSAMTSIHARRKRQKQRRQTGWVDCDEKGNESAENGIVEPHATVALSLVCHD
jgi:hypothetical protein